MKSLRKAPRILGGQWKNRALPLAPGAAFRPTLSIHKTRLFNWLQTVILGAAVMDLFAGSGSLGLEALSRGACFARLLEKDRSQANELTDFVVSHEISRAEVCHIDASRFLKKEADRAFDLVFLDPPFGAIPFERLAQLLETNRWLAEQALIYCERPRNEAYAPPHPNWSLYRQKNTQHLSIQLYQRRFYSDLLD